MPSSPVSGMSAEVWFTSYRCERFEGVICPVSTPSGASIEDTAHIAERQELSLSEIVDARGFAN